MNRRTFLALAAAGAFGSLRTASAQTLPASQVPYGERRMRISDGDRDGILFVPKMYKPGVPTPLLVMLHGLGGSAEGARFVFPMAEELGVIVVAPDSRGITWGQEAPGFDADVRYIGEAFREVADFLTIDPKRVGLGGVSDGATYAFAMGLAYGDRFNHLLIFASSMMAPLRKQGKPLIFIGHGINDTQMPIDRTARRIVPQLKDEGYDVIYREHKGGHGAPRPLVHEAIEWLVATPVEP